MLNAQQTKLHTLDPLPVELETLANDILEPLKKCLYENTEAKIRDTI